MSRPKINIARLREIGWANWDPINLKEEDGTPPIGAEDEYDSYLLQAAGMRIRGIPVYKVADYLERIESDHMGFGSSSRVSALITVREIGAYLTSLGYKVGDK